MTDRRILIVKLYDVFTMGDFVRIGRAPDEVAAKNLGAEYFTKIRRIEVSPENIKVTPDEDGFYVEEVDSPPTYDYVPSFSRK